MSESCKGDHICVASSSEMLKYLHLGGKSQEEGGR
jgi:hypothetical protein